MTCMKNGLPQQGILPGAVFCRSLACCGALTNSSAYDEAVQICPHSPAQGSHREEFYQVITRR